MMKKTIYLFILILLFSCTKKLPKTLSNVIGMQFVLVPKGNFKMGDEFKDGFKDEQPIHTVYLSNYYIGKYEVTQQEWKKIDTYNPSKYKNDSLPVERVSWETVNEFIKKLNQHDKKYHYRLPTEAEWEKAAKGGNKALKTKYAGSNNLFKVGFFIENSPMKPSPVGKLAPNELGIYDMSGNVSEWCADWYSSKYYAYSRAKNPKGSSKKEAKVIRGGSWYGIAADARVTDRDYEAIDFANDILGFRLVLEIK